MPNRPRANQPTREPVPHIFPEWGVDVFESHHAAGWTMPPAAHEFMKLILVHDGSGHLEMNGEVMPCRRGNALIVPVGTTHVIADSAAHPMSLYVVSVQPRILEASCFRPDILPSGVIQLSVHAAEKVERGMRRLLFEQTLDLPTTGAQMLALTLRLFVDVARILASPLDETAPGPVPQVAHGSDSVTRMRSYVEDLAENFFEATNLDAAASTLGLSRRRFTQLFREVAGTSWLAYVRRLRIDHAKKLLESTDRTVLSVAFECGFEDLSTFYRAFKRETGDSPNKWRTAKPEDHPGGYPGGDPGDQSVHGSPAEHPSDEVA